MRNAWFFPRSGNLAISGSNCFKLEFSFGYLNAYAPEIPLCASGGEFLVSKT